MKRKKNAKTEAVDVTQDPKILKARKKGAKEFKKEMTSQRKEFDSLMSSQMDALRSFYSTAGSEQRKMIEQTMAEQQESMKASLDSMRESYELFEEYMTEADKKAFETLYSKRMTDLNNLNDSLRGTFKFAQDAIEEVEEEIERSSHKFRDSINSAFESVRDTLNTLNINNIASSMGDQIDGVIDNRRQMSRTVGSSFDFEAYNANISSGVTASGNHLGRTEVSEMLSNVVMNLGIDDQELLSYYSDTIVQASDVLGADINSLENMIWADIKAGANGKVMKKTLDVVADLNRSGLNLNYDGLLDALNNFAEAAYGLAGGDEDKQANLSEEYAMIVAAGQDSTYTKAADMLTEVINMSSLEEFQNSNIAQMLGYNGVGDIEAWYGKLMSGDEGSILEASKQLDEAYYNYIKGIQGANGVIINDSFGLIDSAANAMSYVTAYESGKGFSDSLENASNADDAGGLDSATEDADSGMWTELKNAFLNNPMVASVTDWLGTFDVTTANLANAATIAMGASELFSNLPNLLSKIPGLGKITGFFKSGIGKIGTMLSAKFGGKTLGKFGTKLANKFGSSASGVVDDMAEAVVKNSDDVAKGSSKFFSKIFKNTSDDAAKGGSKIFSKLFKSTGDDMAKGGSKIFGKFFSSFGDDAAKGGSKIFSKVFTTFGDDALKIGAKGLGKVVGKVAPVLSVIEVAADFAEGTKKATEWFGPEATGQQTIASGIGAALGGTGPAIDDKNATIGQKALAIGSGALKGAGIGAMFGPIGAAIGAGVGAVGAAIGGERIAKFVDGVTTQVTELADVTIRGTTDVLKELGPAGELAGRLVENQWDNVLQTKESIEAVWADPNKGIVAKVGGTLVEATKGVFNSVKGVFTTVKDFGKDMWNKAKDFASKAWDKTKEIASKVWSGVKDAASKVWSEVKEVAGAVWDGMLEGVDAFADAGATLMEAGGSLLEGAGAFASGVGEAIGSIYSGIGEAVGNAVGGALSGLGDAVGEAVGGALSGLGNLASGLGDTASGIGDGIGNVFEGFGNMMGSIIHGNGTSVDVEALQANLTGDPILDRLDIISAYVQSIESKVGGSSGGGGIVSNVINAGANLLGGIVNTGKEFVGGVIDWGKEKVGNIVEGGKELAGNIVEGVGDFIEDPIGTIGGLFGFEDGLSNVPHDGMALIHEGEAVLTKEQASLLRTPADGGIDIASSVGSMISAGVGVSMVSKKKSSSLWKSFGDAVSKDAKLTDMTVSEFAITVTESVKGAFPKLEDMIDEIMERYKEQSRVKKSALINTAHNSDSSLFGLLPFFGSGGVISKPTLAVVGENGPEVVLNANQVERLIGDSSEKSMNGLFNTLNSYDTGTAWVPNDQLAMIHEGEMIVPAEYNPYNNYVSGYESGAFDNVPNSTNVNDVVYRESGNDNSDVVDAILFMAEKISRKLDEVKSSNESKPNMSSNLNADNSDVFSYTF